MGRTACGLGIGLAVAVLSGCGGKSNNGAGAADYRAVLTELGEALKTTAADHNKPPAKLAEFERIEPMAPTASPLVRSGELVYLWGAGYAPGGTKVVAFEKKAEAEVATVVARRGRRRRRAQQSEAVAEPTASRVRRWAARAQ